MIIVTNHYWIIDGSTTDVYSSATNTLVPVDDADYQAWLLGSGAATPIASEAELADVLKNHGSPLPSWLFDAPSFIQPMPDTYTKDQLTAYTVYSRWVKEQGGMTLSSGMPIKTDDRAQAKINGVALWTTGKTNITTTWHAADDTFWPLQETNIVNMSNELQQFIYQCFNASSATAAAIQAGTVTTLAQIDAAFNW